MADLRFAVGMLVLVAAVFSIYGIRAVVWGRARHWRVEKDGGSVFVGKSFMEIGYWLVEPLIGLLHRAGVSPNAVTTFALVPALGAGVAVSQGYFGLASALGTLAAFCDIVDGLLARRAGLHSSAGEAFDAIADRYAEFFLIGGLTIYYRFSAPLCAVGLFALYGAFMVSYTTAKAEALGVPPPRGSMRRAERAVYLLFGLAFTPVATVFSGSEASVIIRQAPVLLALGLIATFSNVSAIRRAGAIMRALRERDRTTPSSRGAGAESAAAVSSEELTLAIDELDKRSRFV